MIAEGNCFAATLDADSEGEEGAFYVWTEAEIDTPARQRSASLLQSRLRRPAPTGNWEGHTILNRSKKMLLGDDAHESAAGQGLPQPSCSTSAPSAFRPGATTRCWPTGTV